MPYDAAPDDQDDDDVFFGLHRESFCCNVCYSCSHPKVRCIQADVCWPAVLTSSPVPRCAELGGSALRQLRPELHLVWRLLQRHLLPTGAWLRTQCLIVVLIIADVSSSCAKQGRVLSRFRRAVYQAITMSWFDNAVTALIIFNTIIISINFWDEPSWYSTILQRCNDVCTWLYVLEMVLKWYARNSDSCSPPFSKEHVLTLAFDVGFPLISLAFGPRQYLRQRTNQWDLLVVIASVVDFLGNSVFLFSVHFLLLCAARSIDASASMHCTFSLSRSI